MDDSRALIAACESEAIHSPGSIQPWGAMLIADEHDLTVLHASANLHAFLGVAGGDAIGLKLADLVGEAPASDMLTGAALDASSGVTLWLPPQAPGLPRLAVSCLRTEGALYVELEPDRPLAMRPAFAGLRSRDIVEALTATASREELFTVAMARLRRVLDFDRVLIYRFNEDCHGEVLSDDHAPDMETLLGLHFPSEDIPPPAWRIFARLGVRVIGNSHAAPVPLLGHAHRAPNLALTALRSPSACHMEYLRNMGSHATATVPLTVDGTLWGILAGHHRAAAHVPAARRALCELVGQVTALKLANLRNAEARYSAKRRRAHLNGMADRLSARCGDSAHLAPALAAEETALLSLCGAEGAILRLGGQLACCGRAPDPEAAAVLLDALLAHEPSKQAARHAGQDEASPRDGASFSFDDMGAALRAAAPACSAAGALVLKLPQGQGDAIAWLRPEHASVVRWGGDPRRSVTMNPDTGRLMPRASFAVWREELRGRCKPWDEEAHKSASDLRSMIEKLQAGYAEAMRAARETAERATRAKSNFLATMSHEIRSPMSGLLGVLELLRATKLDAEQAGMAGMIHNSASMLLAVLNDILDFSKIEAGALSITLEPVGLRALLGTLVQPHSIAAARKGLAANVIIGPEVPDRVRTDRLRLSQILGNLISNAVKFTGAGEISLRVDRQSDAAGDKLRFTVADTGIGMSDEVLGRLFAPFMQADGSTTRNFGGTGLGLCISRQLAGLLGGDLCAASKLGEGSAFTLMLPLDICAAEADEIAPPAQPAMGFESRAWRVLVVDDDPTIRWLSQRQLVKLGITADSADDGETGLCKLLEADYDLLLTDCHMPRMDGVALTRAVRAMSGTRLAAIPIIGLTADVTEAQRTLCEQAGMSELAIKPQTVERLADLLHRHLPSTELRTPSPQEPARDAAPALRSIPFDDQIYLSIFPPGDTDGAQWLHDWLATAHRDAAELAATLDHAPDDFDRDAVRRMAHRLAGASFSVGAMRLGEAGRDLENAASDASVAGLRACQDRIRQELADSEAAIVAFLAG